MISDADGRLDRRRIAGIARDVHALRGRGLEVILVSSGAIGAGMGELGMDRRPGRLPELQAAAAVGQGKLIGAYDSCFARRGYHAAQILLTRPDFDDRSRYLNAANTMRSLLSMDCVPVVNENDTTSVEEIGFGDNDMLSAMVTLMLQAQLLILLSVAPGLYRDAGSGGEIVAVVERIDDDIRGLVSGGTSARGSGGMGAKLDAALMVTGAGEPVIMASGLAPKVLTRLMDGEPLGTLFLPAPQRMRGRKRWIGYGTRPRGRVIVDDGARRAIVERGKSLLARGITGVTGAFDRGALIAIVGPRGEEFARGLANYSSDEISAIRGLRSSSIEKTLGSRPYDEVVHRDNLTLR